MFFSFFSCCLATPTTKVREIFAEYDENFLAVSLDEAYLDITGHLVQRLSWPDSMRTHHLCSAGAEQRVLSASW